MSMRTAMKVTKITAIAWIASQRLTDNSTTYHVVADDANSKTKRIVIAADSRAHARAICSAINAGASWIEVQNHDDPNAAP